MKSEGEKEVRETPQRNKKPERLCSLKTRDFTDPGHAALHIWSCDPNLDFQASNEFKYERAI